MLSVATAGRGAGAGLGPSTVGGTSRGAGSAGRRRLGESRGARAVAAAATPPAAIRELVAIADATNRGESLTKDGRRTVEDLCSRISAEGSPRAPVTKEQLSKTWKLVLTTEKVNMRADAADSLAPSLTNNSS